MDAGTRAASARLLLGRALGVSIVVVAVLAGLYAYRLTFVQPRTDDAAVRANVVGIAPQVSGPIVDLRVVDNQHLSQGDLLFAIDCRPYGARPPRSTKPWPLAAMRPLRSTNRTTSTLGPKTSWPRSVISTRAWRPPRRACERPSSTLATVSCARRSTAT